MASDPTLIYIKANAMSNALVLVPKDLPGWRDLDIQTAKLNRMLQQFLKKFENELGPLQSNKVVRSAYGEAMRKLSEQEKKTQAVLSKVMEEYFVKTQQGTRKGFRKDLQKLTTTFDKMVFEAKKQYMKQLSGLINESGKKLTP